MDIDHGRLSRLRQGQGEIANHVIDEYAAGRLSRRDFLRRGAVVGISLPVLVLKTLQLGKLFVLKISQSFMT